ncbi:hypothetical protein O181_038606 [Austropuccinia psidii MF-1]|uniref:Uncharacterized protein n=1 Tax=Austropuccinia psidii MF-1 TaxID=1389203 RepID=A0A9Q3DEB0_9BASI|nr:hypothetical protein [Austropuccinia psidii MF-1]
MRWEYAYIRSGSDAHCAPGLRGAAGQQRASHPALCRGPLTKMPASMVHAQPQQQSVLQKLGMGAAMGGAVGMTLGFLFGGYAIITRGAGPRGPLNTLATYMMSSGGTFAFFMSIGSVIRTETHSSYTPSQLALAKKINLPLGLEKKTRQLLTAFFTSEPLNLILRFKNFTSVFLIELDFRCEIAHRQPMHSFE